MNKPPQDDLHGPPPRDGTDVFATDHLSRDLRRRTARGGFVTLSGQGVRFVLSVGSTMVLARLLTPEDFGLVAMVTAVTGFLAVFKDLGLSQATVQRQEIHQDEVSTLFWVNVGTSVLLGIVVALLAPLLARLYEEDALTTITLALSIGFVLSGLGVQHAALLQRQMRFTALVAIDLASLALGVLAGIATALAGAGYWALVAMPLVTSATATAGYWLRSGWRPSKPGWAPGTGSLLSFGGYLTGFNTVNYVSRNLDNVLIGWRWGAASLGLYSRAYQLLLLPLHQINAPIGNVMVPSLSRLQGEPERYRRAYLDVLAKMLLVTSCLIGFLIATSDWVVDVFLGPQWHDAAQIFLWLGIAALVQPVANTTGWLFITQQKTRQMFVWGIIGAALSVASFLVGLPFGAVGVAAAYAISGLVIRFPLLMWYVGRIGPVSAGDMYRASFKPVLMGLAVLLAVGAFRLAASDLQPLWGLVLGACIALAVAAPMLRFTELGRSALADVRLLMRRRAAE
jgi:O-antigen/teichoic acid export membrane protein